MHLRFNAPVSVVEDDEIREAPCHMRHGAAARRHSAVAAAAAAVAQANPLRATHAAAHHKMLPPLHGAPRACGSRAKVPRPCTPKAASASRRETCAAVKACTALRCGATGCRGRSPSGWIPLQQLRGPCRMARDSPPGGHTTSWAIRSTRTAMSGERRRGLTTGSCASERASAGLGALERQRCNAAVSVCTDASRRLLTHTHTHLLPLPLFLHAAFPLLRRLAEDCDDHLLRIATHRQPS
ncbi:hypothetical protein TcG_06833 [Trypanosoma cruzi]|nr:hypothetical protein TcG_06833 [Trypanosoma cruzi]